jgi:alpha-D-ribose 1-methylphosphonate 5-triphosphate diphosphatase
MSDLKDFRIVNAMVVTPDAVLEHSEITVIDGRIETVGPCKEWHHSLPCIDVRGRILLPGFVDMHSDAIEKEIEPRPGSTLPVDVAVFELDRKLAAAGITTMYHSLTFIDSKLELIRCVDMVDTIIHGIHRLKPYLLVNTAVHARFEITSSETYATLKGLVEAGLVDLLSIMDHTPGQGQFTTAEQFRDYYGPRFTRDEEKLQEVMKNLKEVRESVGLENAHKATGLCRKHGIPLASHDDDTADKIDFIHACGAIISEFPITFAAAEAARERGLAVAVGSPNIVRGGSHNGNLSAEELIRNGLGTIVCSDYIPSTMMHAAFHLYARKTASLPEVSRLFATNAAVALGIAGQTGSIASGLAADLVVVDTALQCPRVAQTFVKGREVYSACLS